MYIYIYTYGHIVANPKCSAIPAGHVAYFQRGRKGLQSQVGRRVSLQQGRFTSFVYGSGPWGQAGNLAVRHLKPSTLDSEPNRGSSTPAKNRHQDHWAHWAPTWVFLGIAGRERGVWGGGGFTPLMRGPALIGVLHGVFTS